MANQLWQLWQRREDAEEAEKGVEITYKKLPVVSIYRKQSSVKLFYMRSSG